MIPAAFTEAVADAQVVIGLRVSRLTLPDGSGLGGLSSCMASRDDLTKFQAEAFVERLPAALRELADQLEAERPTVEKAGR